MTSADYETLVETAANTIAAFFGTDQDLNYMTDDVDPALARAILAVVVPAIEQSYEIVGYMCEDRLLWTVGGPEREAVFVHRGTQ